MMNGARYAEGSIIIPNCALIVVAMLSSNRREPAVVFLRFSRDRLEECFLDTGRDRAAFALADDSAIELTYRRYFGSGSSEERFVSDVQIIARNAPGRYRVPHLASERDHGVARDADQRTRELGL